MPGNSQKAKPGVISRISQYTSELVNRARLRSRLGMSYDDKRDLYEALGYELEPTFDYYYALYSRNEIARAIIDKPVEATWRGGVTLVEKKGREKGSLEKSVFEKAWEELEDQLHLMSRLKRLDRLSCIGQYGVLFLGFDDVTDRTQLRAPVSGTGRKLLYVKPFSETSAVVKKYDSNTASPRYGLPETYELTITVADDANTNTSIEVHYTRILHITNEPLENDVLGEPVLKGCCNRLKDLEKLVGGSAEMFWRGARSGYQAVVDKDYDLNAPEEAEMQDQFNEYEHNLRRILMLEGMKLEALAPEVSDPTGHFNIQIACICAESGIPQRILLGSERGELASSTDRDTWFDLVESRREDYAEPVVLRPLIERLVERGVLPKPGLEGFDINWVDLRAPGEKDKADVGKVRADSLDKYAKDPISQAIIPYDAFSKYFLGFNDEQIEDINKQRKQSIEDAIAEEEEDFAEPGPEEDFSNQNPDDQNGNDQNNGDRRANATGA